VGESSLSVERECTELLLHYREIARLVWNLGFWPNSKLREWDAVEIFRETMARLFEGMVLLALGFQGSIKDKDAPGEIADFRVKAHKREVELLVERNRPDDPGHIWGDPTVRMSPEASPYRLRFVRFFDWDQLGMRDLRFLEVLIESMDDRPDLIGRHAIIEFECCSISLAEPTR
jgi:hypothetical protein